MQRPAEQSGTQPAMRHSGSWPLLGLLIERPGYGYELMQRFERIYADALSLNLSSPKRTYQALEELLQRGLIEPIHETDTDGRPPRKPRIYYQATAQGKSAYEEWLISELTEARQRSWLFARQLSSLDPQHAIEVVDRFERECLEESGNADPAERHRQDDRTDALVERLTREDERLTLGVKLSWFQYARRELRALIGRRPKQEDDRTRWA